MIENDLNKVLNYMKQYVENKYEHDSEPMLTAKDLQTILDYIKNLKQALNEIREYINIEIPLGINWGEDILQIIDKVLGDDEKCHILQ